MAKKKLELNEEAQNVVGKILPSVEQKPELACVAFKTCKDRDCDKCEFNKKSDSEKAFSEENENADKQAEVTEKTKDGQSAETLNAIPPEYINYRISLKDFLSQKLSLEYSISSLKTQLKAVDKRIEEMNKQFANGEYTGELFSQEKNNEPIENSPQPKREDGPEYEKYLSMVKATFDRIRRSPTFTLEYKTLCEFIIENPDSATARLLYSKVEFTIDENEEYKGFELPELDERTDFPTFHVSENDRMKYDEMLSINYEEYESDEDEGNDEDKPVHKFGSKKKRTANA